MISFDRLELMNWDIQSHQVLPLAHGVTLLTGENGSGKTSVLDAIKVVLGAGSLGDQRSIRSYLAKQSQPVAMIRMLVDNRPVDGTRRRPFDPLGAHSRDLVTLAVVFRADGENDYNKEYFILDGDVVPIERLRSGRARIHVPEGTRQEYRERLKRVGIGDQYRKLLCRPQGQIASFCKKGGTELFDDLYDIIGGRSVLERWQESLRELGRQQREQAGAQQELEAARRQLDELGRRVQRFREYEGLAERLGAARAAGPYVELRSARRAVSDAEARVVSAASDLDAAVAARDAARQQRRQAAQAAEQL